MVYNPKNCFHINQTEFGSFMDKISYKIKLIVADDGERLPIMINNGELHYYANLYALTNLRMRNRASSTVENALRSIIIAHQFLDNEKIDLERRLIGGSFLTRPELEGLTRAGIGRWIDFSTNSGHTANPKHVL